MSAMVVDHCPTLEFYGFVLDGHLHISPTNIDPGTRIKSSRKASEEE